MLFPTAAFAVFFVTAFTVNWLLRPHVQVWRWALIGLSLYFLAWADGRFAVILVGTAAVTWALARAAHGAMRDGQPTLESRRLVRAAVALDLVALAVFRYHDFFVESFADALGTIGLHPAPPALDILVPLGVSFTTFRAISYVVDVGRADAEPIELADVLLYLAFFPNLVAGPIARVGELVPQFHRRPDPRRVPATEAFVLIGCGLFKKVVVASYLGAELVDPVFGVPGAHSGRELLVGVYGYAVQIYADFSGYTDIALGCALLLGIRLPQNFDAPYRSLSVREFWHRWHITLGRWLRDYVYVPLGGSRDGTSTTYRNLMVTMLLGGLWHGADWRFVVWGGLHGTFLVGERVATRWRANRVSAPVAPRPLSAVARWFLTFNLVCLAWIFFRADSAGTAFDIIGRIVTAPGPTTVVTGLAVATIVAALASQLVPEHRTAALRAWFSGLAPAGQAALLAGALTLIAVLGPDGVAPFIYFQF